MTNAGQARLAAIKAEEVATEWDRSLPQNGTAENRKMGHNDASLPQNGTAENRKMGHIETSLPQNGTAIQHFLNSTTDSALQTQHVVVVADDDAHTHEPERPHACEETAATTTAGPDKLSRREIFVILNRLRIAEPTRSRLAGLDSLAVPGYLAAWESAFDCQSGLGIGWLIRQLEAEAPPPEASPTLPSSPSGLESSSRDSAVSPIPSTAPEAAPSLVGPESPPSAESAPKTPAPPPESDDEPVLATITRLYEAEIGRLTPLVRDELLEATDPEGDNLCRSELWEYAFREAVTNNIRKWSYVLKIARAHRHRFQGHLAEPESASEPATLSTALAPAPTGKPVPPAATWWCKTVLPDLRGQMTQATYDHWVKDTVLLERTETEAGLSLVIGAKSRFAVEWLEHRLAVVIRRSIAALTDRDEETVELAFVTETGVESSPMMEEVAA